VEKICEYLVHRNAYENAGPKEEIPEFMTRIPPEMALEL
jgi:transcription elongation factor B subunit 1